MKYTLFAMLVVFSLSAVAEETEFEIKPGEHLKICGGQQHDMLWIDLFRQVDWNFLSSTSQAKNQHRYQLLGGWKKIGVNGEVQRGRYIKLTSSDCDQGQPTLTLYNWGRKPISGIYQTFQEEIYYSDDEDLEDNGSNLENRRDKRLRPINK